MMLLKPILRDTFVVVRVSSRSVMTTSVRTAGDGGKRKYNFDAQSIINDEKKGVFRVLQLGRAKDEAKRKRRGGLQGPAPPQRADKMVPDQRWGNVWPAQRTFHPAVVPLPVRQGVIHQKAQVRVICLSFLTSCR